MKRVHDTARTIGTENRAPKDPARPTLTRDLPAEAFVQWYWLKSELRAFCVQQGLGGQGSKVDLQCRIQAFLESPGQVSSYAKPAPTQPRADAMPSDLSAQTPIGKGWKLNAQLRGFFESQLNGPFRFNQALRDLFKDPQGRTLGDALALYESTRHQKNTIGQPFQYNQHMREYFAAHPGASMTDAIRAWRDRRARGDVPQLSQHKTAQ